MPTPPEFPAQNEAMTTEERVRELKSLTRGRGLRAEDVAQRIGPTLKALANVTPADSSAQVRQKVVETLTRFATQLPEDFRVAAMVALALHGPTDQFLQDRLSWLAKEAETSERSARRRADVALRLLGELVDEQVINPEPQQEWHTQSLRGLLRLDLEQVVVEEDRVIVSLTDNLTELQFRFTSTLSDLERTAATLIRYGGTISGVEHVTPTHHKMSMRLPTPLGIGDKHEYGVRYTTVARAVLPPFYVLTPLHRCERFVVRVRFGAELPHRIWRLPGIPPRTIDEFDPGGELLTADDAGDVMVEFSRMQLGLSYGVGWSADASPWAAAESH
jgi:hypothetical protein